MTREQELFSLRWELEGRNSTDQVLCVQVGATAEELR